MTDQPSYDWMPLRTFTDRDDAGTRLGEHLARRDDLGEPMVLGLPRGGVPVAARVARALRAPLDVIVARKVGVPFQPEVAMGAIGEGGVRYVDTKLLPRIGVTEEEFAEAEARERIVLEERVERFRGARGRPELRGRTALIVDDGIATGATAIAACRVARALGASRVIVAAPVGSPQAIAQITDADEVVCLLKPDYLGAVGAYYRHFDQTSDAEVVELLEAARAKHG